jgi:hypothetical protein
MYGFKIFYEEEFSNVTATLLKNLQEKISRDDQTYLLNVNETEYLDYVIRSLEIGSVLTVCCYPSYSSTFAIHGLHVTAHRLR